MAAALATVSTAQAQAVALEERIGKEEVILSEKKGASLKLLVLIGQDTAILKQHSRLLSKQRERISHLKKVCMCELLAVQFVAVPVLLLFIPPGLAHLISTVFIYLYVLYTCTHYILVRLYAYFLRNNYTYVLMQRVLCTSQPHTHPSPHIHPTHTNTHTPPPHKHTHIARKCFVSIAPHTPHGVHTHTHTHTPHTHTHQVIPEFEHACDLSLQDKGDIITSSQQLVLNMDQSGLCELRTILRPPEELEQLLVAVISVIKGPTADITWTKGAKRLMANLDRYVLYTVLIIYKSRMPLPGL